MSKKAFKIEKSESFKAGISTKVTIDLDKDGKGTAKVEWKRGEPQLFPVQKGQRIFLNMWGGFPEVSIWNAPLPPKDPIRKFLWNQGLPKKKVWDWNDKKFDIEDSDDVLKSVIDEWFSIDVGVLKVAIYARRWQSSMTGNWETQDWDIMGIAVKEGSTLEDVQKSWEELMKLKPKLIECPGLQI